MAEPVVRVELTASFMDRLAAIESLSTDPHVAPAFDRLLGEFRTTVIPVLRRFARIGRRYLNQPPRFAKVIVQPSHWRRARQIAFRVYLPRHYLIQYTRRLGSLAVDSASPRTVRRARNAGKSRQYD